MSQSVVSFQTATETQDAEVQMAAHAFAQALAEIRRVSGFRAGKRASQTGRNRSRSNPGLSK